MNELEKAARLALEFVEYHSKYWNGEGTHPQEIVTALRQALEQPTCKQHLQVEHPAQDEPVAVVGGQRKGWFYLEGRPDVKIGDKLYTRPQAREWVGLTDGERAECNYDNEGFMVGRDEAICKVEAKLKGKNT